jgi:UDP-N-acetylglucosamine--N-acetylmuramyl-(pentapeptide) pyrophosphoryl-undecaprenol N-acetylglucosamine transferase
MNRSKKIIIAGGGTGGHIFPAIAIANAIKQQQPATQFLFVGANGKMEMEKVPQAGYDIKGIDIAGFNRSNILKNIGLPFKLAKSFLQVKKIFRVFQPDAVIGVGGYSSFPVLRFAQSKSIPTFIHESNSFAGKSNILLGKKATQIFVASSGMEQFFPAEKIMITGNPVRAVIANSKVTKAEGLQFFKLKGSSKTIFVTGGSLGAKSINEAIAKDIGLFIKNDMQLIWQTGKPFADHAKTLCKGIDSIYTCDFLKEMEYAFAAADVVISRSGAMAIAELSILNKPTVFVPYPFAAEDHQTVNAMHLVNHHAAKMIKDSEVNEKLVMTAIELAYDLQLQQTFKTNIGKLAMQDVDATIAQEILSKI